jgi:hypothetical protein
MAKAARRRKPSPRDATREQLAVIHRTLDERRELIEQLQRTCNIQFERIAQMQAQLDQLERRLRRTNR